MANQPRRSTATPAAAGACDPSDETARAPDEPAISGSGEPNPQSQEAARLSKPALSQRGRRRMHTDNQLARMPAWPLLMNAAIGALYLGLSPASFLGLMRRCGVRPVELGLGVVRWRRSDLDSLIGALPYRGELAPQGPSAPDFDAALARSAQRRPTRRRAVSARSH